MYKINSEVGDKNQNPNKNIFIKVDNSVITGPKVILNSLAITLSM